ncbi:MAG TPA: hypothetical protein VNI54_12080 [Thermoanaerobaculia bacterium]|nr:hypothetical protein [Thermoanaerobaculia bacterium]
MLMRRISLALLLLPLALACASQPKKLAGKYAIVVEPWLESRQSARDLTAALTNRLNVAASPAEADAVILLKRGRTDADIAYEIRRGNESIVSTEPTSTVQVRGDQRSVKETLEWQRREEEARWGVPVPKNQESFRPPTALESRSGYRSAQWKSAHRIAEMIVYDLRTRL